MAQPGHNEKQGGRLRRLATARAGGAGRTPFYGPILIVLALMAGTAAAQSGTLRLWQVSPVLRDADGECTADFAILAEGFNQELTDVIVDVTFVDAESDFLGIGAIIADGAVGGGRDKRITYAPLSDLSEEWQGKEEGTPQPLCQDGTQLVINAARATLNAEEIDLLETGQLDPSGFEAMNIRVIE